MTRYRLEACGWGWPHPGETSGSGWWPGNWHKHRIITRLPQQRYHGDMVKTCLHILISKFKYHQGNRSWEIRRQPAMKPFDKIKLFYHLFETLCTHTHIYIDAFLSVISFQLLIEFSINTYTLIFISFLHSYKHVSIKQFCFVSVCVCVCFSICIH